MIVFDSEGLCLAEMVKIVCLERIKEDKPKAVHLTIDHLKIIALEWDSFLKMVLLANPAANDLLSISYLKELDEAGFSIGVEVGYGIDDENDDDDEFDYFVFYYAQSLLNLLADLILKLKVKVEDRESLKLFYHIVDYETVLM